MRTGTVGRFREDAPTLEVGIGSGDGGADSHSESVIGGGESGFGGGSTSPGTVILRPLCRGRWAEAPRLLSGRGPFRVRRAVPSVPLIAVRPRVVWGDLACGTGVGSREGGFGRALSLEIMLVRRLE